MQIAYQDLKAIAYRISSGQIMLNWSILGRWDKTSLIVTPILFSLLMGTILGIWARRPYPILEWNALYWAAETSVGVIIYLAVVMFGSQIMKREFKSRFTDHWPFTLTTLILVFLLNLAQPLVTIYLSADPLATYQRTSMFITAPVGKAALFLLLQVAGSLIISEAILQTIGYWRVLERILSPHSLDFKNGSSVAEHQGIGAIGNRFISIGDGPDSKTVAMGDISHIEVQNHFTTVTYKSGSGWKQWGAYTPLADFENQCPFLLRINRSTLIHPEHIAKLEKAGRQYQVQMNGAPDQLLLVSRSRNDLVRQLLLEKELNN